MIKESLEKIARDDGRFNPNAVKFVYEGLNFATKDFSQEPFHVSGQDLCEGLRKLALKKWGRLTMLVLNNWKIKTTRDFGDIVYLMIKHNWMSAQPTDTIEDFNNVYEFKTVFKDNFEF